MKHVIGLALLAWLCSAAHAAAQTNLATPHITINGQTQQLVKPDGYTLIVGVEAYGPVHTQAMAENAQITERVLAEAKQRGIDPNDLRTARINLAPYDSSLKRYRADNLVYVTLRDIEKAEQLVAALINAGANRVHGIRPVIKRNDDLLNRLRGEAVAKARQAALETATAAGVRLGPVLSINAQHYDWHGQMAGLASRGLSQDLSSVPIEPGLIPIAINVSVTWGIEQ